MTLTSSVQKGTKRQGRIAHHLRNSCGHATVPHIVALLGSTFQIANIGIIWQTAKRKNKKVTLWRVTYSSEGIAHA